MPVKMMPMTVERSYAGQPASERREKRRRALVEAGHQLLGTQGIQGTTVRSVCRESGLSSRYFYESFATLDDLLIAVFDNVMAEGISKAFDEIARATDLRSIVAAIGTTFGNTFDDPLGMRITLIEAWGSEALMRRRVETLHAGASMLAAAVKSQKDHRGDGSVEVAAFAIMGGFLECMLAWVDGALDMPREVLIERFIDSSVATMEQALEADSKSPAPGSRQRGRRS